MKSIEESYDYTVGEMLAAFACGSLHKYVITAQEIAATSANNTILFEAESSKLLITKLENRLQPDLRDIQTFAWLIAEIATQDY